MNINNRKRSPKVFIVILFQMMLLSLKPYANADKNGDYFPLVDNSSYTYRGHFRDKIYDMVLIVKEVSNRKLNGFYFVEKDRFEKLSSHASIYANMFGLGLYSKENNKLYTTRCDFVRELDSISPSEKQTMLTFPLKKGDKKVLHACKFVNYSLLRIQLTVVDFQTVDVPIGTFENCAKIKIEEIWPWTKHVGYAWLAENIGLVKWIRTTGRVDELVSFVIPKN